MKWLMRILGKENKKRAGFTLVELMIVVIIVGILAAAAVPIYRFAVRKAYMSEAKAALGTIRAAELVYHAEHATFLAVAKGAIENEESDDIPGLGMDVSNNTWFNRADCFKVTANATTFTAACSSTSANAPADGYNIFVTLDQAGQWGYPAADPV